MPAPLKSRSLIVALTCVGGLALAASPAHAGGGVRLVTVNGGGFVSLMRACVESYVAQGLSFDDAATQCSSASFPVIPETGIDGAMLARPGNTSDLNIPTCSATNADPLASPIAPIAAAQRAIADAFTTIFDRAKAAADEGDALGYVAMLEFGPPAVAARALAETLEAVDRLADAAAKALAKAAATTPPAHGGSGGSHNQLSRNAINACEEAASFIGACNAEHWKSAPCEIFRTKLDGCADPLLARSDPDGGSSCRMTSVDAGAVETMVAIVCAKDARVAPGQNPCQPIDGVVTRRSYRLPGDPKRTLCSDPRALVEPEDCINEINVLEFGDDIHDVVREAQTRIGGPVVVIPVPAPFPCGMRPCD